MTETPTSHPSGTPLWSRSAWSCAAVVLMTVILVATYLEAGIGILWDRIRQVHRRTNN